MNIEIETLTLNEIEELEELSGISIDSLMAAGTPKGKILKALVYVVLKRTKPGITLEEAGNMPMAEVMTALGAVDEEAPSGND